mmetsp:Transcript_37404/g.51685  ORF Transcript_37404/g.51685 Transcript_37404/m.51685 type:complete len:80 (-) Transcript_37404:974-1213(-)
MLVEAFVPLSLKLELGRPKFPFWWCCGVGVKSDDSDPLGDALAPLGDGVPSALSRSVIVNVSLGDASPLLSFDFRPKVG